MLLRLTAVCGSTLCAAVTYACVSLTKASTVSLMFPLFTCQQVVELLGARSFVVSYLIFAPAFYLITHASDFLGVPCIPSRSLQPQGFRSLQTLGVQVLATPRFQVPATPRFQVPATPRFQVPATPRFQVPATPRFRVPATPRFRVLHACSIFFFFLSVELLL